jgi:hypothetical protein
VADELRAKHTAMPAGGNNRSMPVTIAVSSTHQMR